MALGLEFIHSNKYVHCEISPDNVLVSLAGDRLVISDFGLCKKVYDKGDVQGRDKWMAPELVHHALSRDYSLRATVHSDTFALGCVFYYFLTKGSHPFYEENANNMLFKIAQGKSNLNGE